MNFLSRLFKRPRYTERDIDHWERVYRLQDRQFAAREALGRRWVFHPDNPETQVKRLEPKPRVLRVVIPIRSIPTLRRAA